MSAPISRRGALVAAFAAVATVGTASVASASSSGVNALPSWPVLRSGSNGPDVKTAQYLLTASGHSTTADGAFGPATATAVRSFQSARGLGVDGIVGARTWSALTSPFTLSTGSTGNAVRALQVQLVHFGASIAIDGVYGPRTAGTVGYWQWYYGLTSDNICGPQSWRTFVGH